MSAVLKREIETRLNARGITINALEREAGLKRSAARNIVQGFSKKPSAEVLASIAKVLNCSIDDLMGHYSVKASPQYPKPVAVGTWNALLYLDVIKTIYNCAKEKKLELTYEQVTQTATEIYRYALAKKLTHADVELTHWMLERA